MKREIKLDWNEHEVNALLLKNLLEMFHCTTTESVDAALAYAKAVSKQQLNPDNYPIYFTLLQSGNHWVVDALLGETELEKSFSSVQPNVYIISQCISLFSEKKRGEIYDKLLISLLAILRVAYENAEAGFRIFPLSPEDVNNIGKHLDENQPSNSVINQKILHLLDRIANLKDLGSLPPPDKKSEEAAIQANNIRGKFLDPNKNLSDTIPLLLLESGDWRKTEIPPSAIKAEKTTK